MKLINRLAKFLTVVPLAAAGLLSTQGAAQAGTLILEGSDAIGFHCSFGSAPGCLYRDQVFTAIGGASLLPIAVVGTTASGFPVVSGTHAIVDMLDLSTAGLLSGYAAIYFTGAGGCCTSNPAAIAGRGGDLSTYLGGVGGSGGTVMIGNYDGLAGWDFLTGGASNSAHVAGVGGALTGPGCTDGELITLAGSMNGFTQPPVISCWTHQAYDIPYFAGLGFTLNFFDSDPAFATSNPGFGPFSSLLSTGVTLSHTPEPGSIALIGLAIAGFAAIRRRKAA